MLVLLPVVLAPLLLLAALVVLLVPLALRKLPVEVTGRLSLEPAGKLVLGGDAGDTCRPSV